MMRHSFLMLVWGLLGSTAWAQDADASDHKVRLQTHFHKPLAESGLGVGGWVVLPDIIGMSTSTLFLMGPRYEASGWWVEGLAGGMMTAGDPVSHPWVLSGRVEVEPEAFDAPLRLWANLQLNDVTGNLQPYALLIFNYALMDEQIFVGLESENHLNWMAPGMNEAINDFSVGPQMMLPFGGLSITTSMQIHPEESVRNQFWLRVMYDFGPIPA